MDAQTQAATQAYTTTKIIYGALIAGLVIFTAIALFLAPVGGGAPPAPGGGGTPPPATPASPGSQAGTIGGIDMLAVLAVGFTVLSIVPSFLLRAVALKKARHPDGSIDVNAVSSGIILQGAMLEGGALFGSVAYLLSAEPVALIAPGLGIGLMLATLPKQSEFLGEADHIDLPEDEHRFGDDV